MRFLKTFLTAVFATIAVVAGIFVTLVVALSTVVVIFARRLLRREQSSASPRPRTRLRPRPEGETIEVAAVEVTETK